MNLNPITWPGNALRLIARLVSDGLNQTRPVTIIQEYPIAAADVDLALIPKGQGALIAAYPDGTAVGGNKRGTYATDLQRQRGSAGQVASGSNSFIGGGTSNTASSFGSCVLGGSSNTANGTYASVLGGSRGTTRAIDGYTVCSASNDPISNAAQGQNQFAFLILAKQTTDATATVLASSSATVATGNQVTLAANSVYYFRASVIAGVTGAGNAKAWEFTGVVKRGATAATTTLVGSVIKNVVAYDAGAAAWDVNITVNTTLGCLTVTVTGAAATTIRWVCKIETTEMTF